MKHSLDDTIAAIATPVGVGGVGVVRLSGDQSIRISEKIINKFPKNIEPQKVYRGWVVDGGKAVDEVLYYYMMSPNSYTGEDVVEISGHGGTRVLREVLDLIIKAGARLAERGEFTKRAFLNGKMDLLQAEAVLDLVSARTGRGLECAADQLEGKLSLKIREIREGLVNLLAETEANIDFPEDTEELNLPVATARIDGCLEEIDRLLETAEEGKILREGVRTAIVGKPNVGKSSLLNALLGEERAIVTEYPGTTRDTIEEVININGLPLVVVDTAGIRHPLDKAEEFGVERARRELRTADLALIVLDASQCLTEEDGLVLEGARESRGVVVLNKVDLGKRISLNGQESHLPRFGVSALTGQGIEELKQGILDYVVGKSAFGGEERCAINDRHKEGLLRARESLVRAGASCRSKMPGDFMAIDLKAAIVALGEVSGEEVSEEALNTIFERFCVGK